MKFLRLRLFLLLVLLALLPMAACTKIVTITAPAVAREYTFGPECDMFGTSLDGTSSLHDYYTNCPAPGGYTDWLAPSGIKWHVVWVKHYTDGKP